MLTFLYSTLKALVLPPGLLLVLILLSLRSKRPTLPFVTLLVLYLFSTPFIGRQLILPLEHSAPLTDLSITQGNAGAIVVLGGGRYSGAPEYGGDSVSKESLIRLRYAAWLHHKTGLRIYASGGTPFAEEGLPEARLAKPVLENEFQTDAVATEEQSANTLENAKFTAMRLKEAGIRTVLLVSHAWHLPRAITEFERQGITAIAAPTAFLSNALDLRPAYRQWLPSTEGLEASHIAMREYIGQIWYTIRSIWQRRT